jgi:glycosyltransferase involved in cell wall biosynthesis
MKVGLFVPAWPPGGMANGIVTYASYLVPALRSLGHEVYVLTFKLSGSPERDQWAINLKGYAPRTRVWDRVMYRLSPANANFKVKCDTISAAIQNLVETVELDILEMEESFGLSFAVSRLNLLPVVVRLHGPWFVNGIGNPEFGTSINLGREEREARSIKSAQMVTAPSADIIEIVKEHYQLRSLNSAVVPNPIIAAVDNDVWDKDRCRKDTLLFVGRMDRRKGADLVIDAFAAMAARYPDLKLVMVGPDTGIEEGNGKAIKCNEYIRANVAEAVRHRIEFLGHVPHEGVLSLRRKCFATIVPSRFEVSPYSVLEAMSLGCPLIATSVGGIPESITDHRNGLLISNEDLAGLIDACETLLSDRGLAAELGRQAWLDSRERFNPSKIAEQTVAAYGLARDEFKRRMLGTSNTPGSLSNRKRLW